jgi:hypothetical protein
MFDVDEPQRSFASAEEAVQAFIAALRNHREAELRAILRPGPTASSTLATDIRSRAELDDWPLPIPLIEERGHWLLTRKRAHRPLLTVALAATSCPRYEHCSHA